MPANGESIFSCFNKNALLDKLFADSSNIIGIPPYPHSHLSDT